MMLLPLVMALCAPADLVTTNLGAGSGVGTTISTASGWKALGFTLPGPDPWIVQSVTLTLDAGAGGQAEVSIWSGESAPTTRLATLAAPAQTGIGDFVFQAAGPVILQPGVKHWLRVARGSASGSFIWRGSSPATMPRGLSAGEAYLFNGNPSSTLNKIRFDAEPLIAHNLSGTGVGSAALSPGGPGLSAGFGAPGQQPYAMSGAWVDVDAPGGLGALSLHSPLASSPAAGSWVAGLGVGVRRIAAAGATLTERERYWVRLANGGGSSWSWAHDSGQAPGLGRVWDGGGPAPATRLGLAARPVVVGNLSHASAPVTPLAGSDSKAMGFRMPAARHAGLWFVDLALDFSQGGGVEVSVWEGDAGPEIAIAVLESPAQTGAGVFSFRAVPAIALEPGQGYWVVVRSTSASPVDWLEAASEARGLGRDVRWFRDGLPDSTPGAINVIGGGYNDCPADFSGASDPLDSAYGVPDGVVDATDLFYFLDQISSGNLDAADLSGSSDPGDAMYGVRDGVIDLADFFRFLDQFVEGCR